MPKILSAFSAVAFFALVFPSAASAAPITLNRTHAAIAWHGRSVTDVRGEMSFEVIATSSEKPEIVSENCRAPGANADNTIAERTTGLKWAEQTVNGRSEYTLRFGVQFKNKEGTCQFIISSGTDRAALTLNNSGRPARE